MSSLLDVRRLTKWFRSTTAVEGIDFSVAPGQAVGLLGPNGAGKTTTMRVLQGTLRPSRGSVSLFGLPPLKVPEFHRRVGFAFDSTGLSGSLSVQSHLAAHRLLAGLSQRDIDNVVERFAISHLLGRRVKRLSTGERKRVALATAMACQPQLLVLDEPTNGLDIEGAHWLRQVILTHKSQGGAVLISSHILSEVEQVVDSVVVIKRHQLFIGGLDDLRDRESLSLEDAYLSIVSTNSVRGAAA
ncbi:ABC transporter ATP-binding protein [Actinomyces sp. 2119]|uniref:ABC transporter ATP-binding protein n=1 Tax=Actinomyces sp. 2119 TaxID=2321393 RepID=UPI000E6C639C|nr:ABC transporter ATP-binding protein [Actinomyces sp. 2119]RJF43794.1 ABC transporter ATP-binding protein [Actinomyces sp. 2119]